MKNQAITNPLAFRSPLARLALKLGTDSLPVAVCGRDGLKQPIMKKACGGVIIDQNGRVLLREPAGHYKGQVWTFAKGKPEPGESSEAAAVREVLEETGIRASVLMRIPGSFDGANTANEYFLMVPLEDTRQFDLETASVKWVTKEEAEQLISLTEKPKRRRRDLHVLRRAFRLFYSLRAAGT